MLAKQPASLGGFEFDAIVKRSETMTCDVPEYATEEGYSITDNICLKPRELEIEAIITNSPVTWLSNTRHHRAVLRRWLKNFASCG